MFGFGFRKRLQHPNTSLYHYSKGLEFSNGAEEFTFHPSFSNPLLVIRGDGGRVAGQLRVTQRPQIQCNLALATAGIGGIQAGQIQFQPLLDPSTEQ